MFKLLILSSLLLLITFTFLFLIDAEYSQQNQFKHKKEACMKQA